MLDEEDRWKESKSLNKALQFQDLVQESENSQDEDVPDECQGVVNWCVGLVDLMGNFIDERYFAVRKGETLWEEIHEFAADSWPQIGDGASRNCPRAGRKIKRVVTSASSLEVKRQRPQVECGQMPNPHGKKKEMI